FAPAYVARSVFLPEAGIDAEFIITHGGAPVYAALASGTAHFGLTATTDFLSNVTRGAKFLAVETMVYQTMDVVVHRQWAEARGLTGVADCGAYGGAERRGHRFHLRRCDFRDDGPV